MSGWRSRKVVLAVRSAWWSSSAGCRGGSPEAWAVLRTSISCRVGDKVDLAHFSWRFVFFSYAGESRVCSSHSGHGVLLQAWVGGRLVSAGVSSVVSSVWVLSGRGPVVLSLLYGFCPVSR